MPVVLVLKQPDLGTAHDAARRRRDRLLSRRGATVDVRRGDRRRCRGGAAGLVDCCAITRRRGSIPFSIPDTDPLGAGYHILQSKIALGSGGLFGKGFLLGTQSHLSFLPEKQTDFIFTMLAEELGLIGGLGAV